MNQSIVSIRRVPGCVLFASLTAIATASCGSSSILGSDDARDDAVVEAGHDAVVILPDVGIADVIANTTDAFVVHDAPDVAASDAVAAIDVAVTDAPGATDAVADGAIRPDAMDAAFVFDAVTDASADTRDATTLDATDARDVFVADATDATDATDASDVTDARGETGIPHTGIIGSAVEFTILAFSEVRSTGPTTVTGEVGVSPGTAVVGIPAGTVEHVMDDIAALGQADATTAYNYLAGLPCGTVLTGLDLGTLTPLPPGVYCFSSSAQLTGTLTLDGQNQPNPRFIFQIGSTLTTAVNAQVNLINGARSCGVYWQTGSSATVDVGSHFAGDIIAYASVTLNANARLDGRAIARGGAVRLDSNAVNNASCHDTDPPTPLGDAGDAGDGGDARDGGDAGSTDATARDGD